MKVIKITYFLLAAAAFTACTSTEDETSIRKQINKYKAEVRELNQQIEELEQKLDPAGSAANRSEVLVAVKAVTEESFDHFFEVSGTVEAVREAIISPEAGGQIKSISVNEGDYVRTGQVIARLNTDITENAINEVQASFDYAEVVYEKQKRLWEKGVGSEIQYLTAKNNRDALANKLETLTAQMNMAILKSPINGIVDDIYQKVGELAGPGIRMMRMVNLDELNINADISESFLSVVKEGDTVEVNFPVYPDLSLNVPVFRTGNVINPDNRTFTMQVKVRNINNMLKPNILSIMRINDYSTDKAIVVPAKIIKQDMQGKYLYIVNEDEGFKKAKKVYIETGLTYNELTEVVRGLNPGDQVIIDGFSQVSDGTPVTVKL